MTILAPTDFSKLSRVAVLYAAKLAQKLKAKLILVNVVFVQASTRAIILSPKLEEEMMQIADEDMNKLLTEIKTDVKGKLNLSSKILHGFPVAHTLLKFMSKLKVDLVVTATHGATGLKKALLGTNAAAMIEESTAPVLVVPRNTSFKNPKKIVYATDLNHLDQELKLLCDFVKPFNTRIDVVHVLPEEAEVLIEEKEIKEDLREKMANPKIDFHIIQNDDITGALDNFMIDQKGDLLTMFTHKLSFFEKLFDRSVTRNIAFHSYIPMLTFNKNSINTR